MLNPTFSHKIRKTLKLASLLGAVGGFAIGLEATIVTSTTPGVAWSPFTVDQFTPSSDLTISLFNQNLEQWEPVTLFSFDYSGTSDFGAIDKLNVTAATATLADQGIAPSSGWRGADQSGNQGAKALLGGTLVNGGTDWASVAPEYLQADTTFGNMALYVPSETSGGDPIIEGLFYNKVSPVYLGFRFKIAESDPDYRFGWIEVTSVAATTLNVNSWAYNDTYGEDLPAGAVPEPATIAAISAILILGFTWFKRRRLF